MQNTDNELCIISTEEEFWFPLEVHPAPTPLLLHVAVTYIWILKSVLFVWLSIRFPVCLVDKLGRHSSRSVLEGPVNITEWTEGEGGGVIQMVVPTFLPSCPSHGGWSYSGKRLFLSLTHSHEYDFLSCQRPAMLYQLGRRRQQQNGIQERLSAQVTWESWIL